MNCALLWGLVLAAAPLRPMASAGVSTAPPHGGLLAPVAGGQLELLVGPDRLALFPLDARLQPLPIADAQAELLDRNHPAVTLAPAGDHWEAANPFPAGRDLSLVAVVRSPAGSSAARFEVAGGSASMFHDHRPFHGGQVGMAGERHLELASVATAHGEELQLYLTDAFRQPVPLNGVSGSLTLGEGGHGSTLPLVPAGDCFTVEAGKPAGPRKVHVHLIYPSAPTQVDMDYYLEPAGPVRSEGRSIRIVVTGSGFSPNRVEAPSGQPLTLRFVRTTDQTCAKRVVFRSLGLERDLPKGREVDVALVPTSGETDFSCGMGMFKGAVVGR